MTRTGANEPTHIHGTAPLALLALFGTGLLFPSAAHAQSSSAAAPALDRAWRVSFVNLSRIESWSFFEPPASGGDPDYTFAANRLRLGLTGTWSRLDVNGVLQYVQFAGLPSGAVGPGPLGAGALYFDHSGTTTSNGVYLRALNVRARLPRGVAVQAGRFGYTSGGESPSGQAKVETIKRARLDSRMLGEFEWSLYQRTFDGVRADVDHRRWHLTAAWLRPTQGGFEDDAGSSLRDVDVAAATVNLRPGLVLAATDVAIFAYRYDDDRLVTARPDNTGRIADRVDVGMTTLGAAAIGSASAGPGEADWLAWVAGQNGSWYEQTHRAWSLALEAGYQWRVRWQPWLRGGYLTASGDGNPGDNRHETFFPMLPTVRRYSFTTAYAPMNLEDAFAELIVRPGRRLSARADVRRLRLAESADRWYGGSGATRRRGAYFGYAGRISGGHTDLGTVVEGAVDFVVNRRWSINAFLGAMRGGRVVQTLFTGRRLRLAYVENAIQF